MEKAAYYEVAQYLLEHNRPVSPAELVAVCGKSRVTIHAALRRLVANGWATKQGSSPYTSYQGVPIQARPSLQHEVTVSHETLRAVCTIGLIEDFVLRAHKIKPSRPQAI